MAATALVVVDMQSAFVEGPEAVPDAAALVSRVSDLLTRARAAGVLVVHLQNDGPPGADDEPGSSGWRLALDILPGPREVIVRKRVDDGFEDTELAGILAADAVSRVVLCGVQSEMCVAATARGALARGLRVILPHDTHATYDIPAAAGLEDTVPARHVARVAEWSLGDTVFIPLHAADVQFEES